ncbi:MAG TPA: Asp-tRNA(Asn)/Glu-tRNA(Gln) amidotransferase subunit GatC [Gemmatimonadaceae bacterium]
MAVTHDDVRHVAALARLAVAESRLDHLVVELNGILGHMDELSKVDTKEVEDIKFAPTESTPVRADGGGPIKMYAPLASFAPAVKDGFIIVHRLATHDDTADRAP